MSLITYGSKSESYVSMSDTKGRREQEPRCDLLRFERQTRAGRRRSRKPEEKKGAVADSNRPSTFTGNAIFQSCVRPTLKTELSFVPRQRHDYDPRRDQFLLGDNVRKELIKLYQVFYKIKLLLKKKRNVYVRWK